jgi:hypothetical protein
MRRAILAMALGSILLTGAACTTDRSTGATAARPSPSPPPPPSPSPSPAPAPAPAATSVASDYSADTRAICGTLETIFTDDLKAFHTQMGKMIANKEAKLGPEAAAAQKAAGAELKKIGAKIKKETSVAQDVQLRDAGAVSASKFIKSATDKSFFDKIKTQKDYDRVIEDQLQEWFTPAAGYCALTLRPAPGSTSAS